MNPLSNAPRSNAVKVVRMNGMAENINDAENAAQKMAAHAMEKRKQREAKVNNFRNKTKIRVQNLRQEAQKQKKERDEKIKANICRILEDTSRKQCNQMNAKLEEKKFEKPIYELDKQISQIYKGKRDALQRMLNCNPNNNSNNVQVCLQIPPLIADMRPFEKVARISSSSPPQNGSQNYYDQCNEQDTIHTNTQENNNSNNKVKIIKHINNNYNQSINNDNNSNNNLYLQSKIMKIYNSNNNTTTIKNHNPMSLLNNNLMQMSTNDEYEHESDAEIDNYNHDDIEYDSNLKQTKSIKITNESNNHKNIDNNQLSLIPKINDNDDSIKFSTFTNDDITDNSNNTNDTNNIENENEYENKDYISLNTIDGNTICCNNRHCQSNNKPFWDRGITNNDDKLTQEERKALYGAIKQWHLTQERLQAKLNATTM